MSTPKPSDNRLTDSTDSGDYRLQPLSGEEEFPSLEEIPPEPALAATVSAARQVDVAASKPELPRKIEQDVKSAPRTWLGLAIAAGACALLFCGTGLGVGVMFFLGPTPAEVAENPSLSPPPPPIPGTPIPAEPVTPEQATPGLATTGNVSPVGANANPATAGTTASAINVTPVPGELEVAESPSASATPSAAAQSRPPAEVVEDPQLAAKSIHPESATAAAGPASALPAESALESAPDPASEPDPVLAAASPPPPPAIESDEQREAYIAHVQAMLEAGLGKARNREKAGEQYRQALAICNTDPRLHYGYALTIQTTQREEAAQVLVQALNQGAFAYPPVWRLLIDMELKKPLEARVIKGLPNFGRRVEASADAWPDEASRVEFAMFLGRVVGFWQGPSGDRKKFEAEIAAADQALLETLVATRLEAYRLGKSDVISRFDLLQQDLSQKSERATDAARQDQSEAERKLASDQQKLKDNEDKLARTKEQFDQEWEEMKAAFLKDWTAMETDFRLVVAQGSELENVLARTERELTFWEQRSKAAFMQRVQTKSKVVSQVELEAQSKIQAFAVQRNLLQLQLGDLSRKAYALQYKGQQRLAEMARAEAAYQRATGQLVKESSLIADKRKTLTDQSDRLEKQPAPKRPRIASTAEMRRFSTYAPLDIDTEWRRIRDSYAAR